MSDNNVVRIFNYPWHLSHQFELMKIPKTRFSWLVQHRRGISSEPRGDLEERFGIERVPYYESGKYDVALCHIDNQSFEEGIMQRGKASLTRDVKDVIGSDIPKILIMHGTPYYPESFENDITRENYSDWGFTEDQIGMSSELIHRFKGFAQDFDAIVFNSRTARRQWGFYPIGEGETDDQLTYMGLTRHGTSQYARAIWHGMDADEWWDLPKEPRVVTMISPAGMDSYYDRSFLRGVKEVLEEKDIYLCHITVDQKCDTFDKYREMLGRSLVYFNPTRESPMPRSRAEAMHSGCCVLTTPSQDADQFIKSGENGIIVPRNPNFVADTIESLILDYRKALEIGQNGKQTARELFSGDRYRADWAEVIETLTGKNVLE